MEAAEVITRTDSWFRQLKGDRLEVYLLGSADGVPIKMRASGPESAIWRCVEMFEEMTGVAVEGEWRRPARTGARPIAGQLTIMEQLESDDGEE